MNDLTNKTIKVGDDIYFICSQLMYNNEYYVLSIKGLEEVSNNINIFKLINEDEKYFISDEIDKKVIEKFVVFLSM
jgi:hypothetical protein